MAIILINAYLPDPALLVILGTLSSYGVPVFDQSCLSCTAISRYTAGWT